MGHAAKTREIKPKTELELRAETLMRERGLTKRALSRAAGVSAPHLGRWLNGARELSLEKRLKVAEVLGVNEAWLTNGKGPTRPLRLVEGVGLEEALKEMFDDYDWPKLTADQVREVTRRVTEQNAAGLLPRKFNLDLIARTIAEVQNGQAPAKSSGLVAKQGSSSVKKG